MLQPFQTLQGHNITVRPTPVGGTWFLDIIVLGLHQCILGPIYPDPLQILVGIIGILMYIHIQRGF